MILFYKALSNLLYPIIVVIIFIRKILKKEDPLRYKEKIFYNHFKVERITGSKLIWFHAASVGELKSIVPILYGLNKIDPRLQFLITTVTLSSAQVVKDELKKLNNVSHRYFPIDSNFLIKKFISSWRPDKIFLVDSEIWPNLILTSKESNIPISLINARITKKTFERWILIHRFAEKIFSCFDLCLSSNYETKDYLEKLKAKNIFFLGNIKLTTNNSYQLTNQPNEKILSKRRFWFALSTHDSEEKLCLDVHLKLRDIYKGLITIIAPRHIQRISSIKKICMDLDLSYQVLGKNELILENKEIILVNYYGNLPVFLRYSKSVFVGKSTIKKLENVGGQNPIEAAKLGCKIYHGPFVYNFKEIYEILDKNKISKQINSSAEMAQNLQNDLKEIKEREPEFVGKLNDIGQKTLNNTLQKINNFI